MNKVLLVLISAHFVGDFLLQPDRLQRRKATSAAILIHSSIIAAVTYFFLQQWTAWFLPTVVFLTHGLIDRVKVRFRDTWRSFCVDQLAHLFVLVVVVWSGDERIPPFHGVGLHWMILLAGFVVAVQGAGFGGQGFGSIIAGKSIVGSY